MFSDENVVLVAIIATLVESGIGVACCIFYILYYNCALLISSEHISPIEVFGFVFYSSYVTSGNCTFKDGTPVAQYNRNTKTKPNSILIWQTVYLVLYLLWIFSSFLLVKARKNPNLYMVPWIAVSSMMIIFDLVTSALSLTDIGVDTNDIFDDNFKEYHIGKFVTLLLYCSKGGLVWFFNLVLLHLVLNILKKMKRKEEKSPYWTDKGYDDIRRELSRKAATKADQTDSWNNTINMEDDVRVNPHELSVPGQLSNPEDRGRDGSKQQNRHLEYANLTDGEMNGPNILNGFLGYPNQNDGRLDNSGETNFDRQLNRQLDHPKQLNRQLDFPQQLNRLLDQQKMMNRQLDYSQQWREQQEQLEHLDVRSLPQQHRTPIHHYREPSRGVEQGWETSSVERYNHVDPRDMERINGNIYQRPQSFKDRVKEAKQNKETQLNMGGMFRYPTDTTKLRQGRRESGLPDQDVETAFDFLSKYEESGESKSREISNISLYGGADSVSGKRDRTFFIPRVRVPANKLRIPSFHKNSQKKQIPVKDQKTKYYVPLKK